MDIENTTVMDTEDTAIMEQPVRGGALRTFGNKLIGAGNYAVLLAAVLIGIWCVGRGFEAFSNNTVFETNIVYWIALSVWILLGTFVVGSSVLYIQRVVPHLRERNVVFSWLFFGLLVAAIVYVSQGYRIASVNLFAIMAGLSDSAQQNLFLLFKFFPATPLVPINLVATKTMAGGLAIDSLMPFVWSSSFIFIFFVWSIVYGAFLLKIRREKPLRNVKIIHLVLSLSGLIVMMTLKSMSNFTKEQLIFFHVSAVVLIVLQVLLTYSSLRYAAEAKDNENEEEYKTPLYLPPSAIKVALFLLLILPILTDIQNQFALAAKSRPVIKELANDQSKEKAKYVNETRISIHSGPAAGDEIIGVLPKGTPIRVLKNKHGWACIGDCRWILSKFLRPVKR